MPSSGRQHIYPQAMADTFPILSNTPAIPGGRRAAEQALSAVDPVRYTRSRNFLDGDVTRLSPYLRHGVLTMAEVRDHALSVVRTPEDAEKFINELGWRDYWQRLYAALQEGIWKDREPLKTGLRANQYSDTLPPELAAANTNLACIDGFSRQLTETGYLHNHSRMWMAAYLVHWRHIRWQAGARWFLEHLLDGDPASNNLSWQWVASTFSNKPYFFNRENLERYTNSVYCRNCPSKNACPFDSSYEQLEVELFRSVDSSTQNAMPSPPIPMQRPSAADAQAIKPGGLSEPLVWIHTDALNPKSPILAQNPSAPAVFIWDETWLRDAHISSKRTDFLAQCLAEMPPHLEQRRGIVLTELLAAAKAAGADHILTHSTVDPTLRAAIASAERTLPVVVVPPPVFADDSRGFDLKRFSRYWQKARASAMRPTRVS